MTHVADQLSPIGSEVTSALAEIDARDAVERLWLRDHTLWQEDPEEVADRLAWLELPRTMADEVGHLESFRMGCLEDGITHALVLGMGGSSLFPLVLAETFPGGDGLVLHVLDSVDPEAVRRVAQALPPERTLVVASSKSGTTVETRSLLAYFWERSGRGDRFAVVTDPGTPLSEFAHERGFRAVFEAEPDVGGRFSALSHFGLVPAALLGVDLAELLSRARAMAERCRAAALADNPAATLAAAMVGAVRAGRDKLTVFPPDGAAALDAWIEQLVAESTGKGGVGVLPIVGEGVGPADVYGDDRLFVSYGTDLHHLADAGHPVVRLEVEDPLSLGAETFRWEAATALAGALLNLNPFDQPDVESAKRAARRLLESGVREPRTVDPAELLRDVGPGDYIAILAYLDPASPIVEELEDARLRLRDRFHVATTLGIGPRYLHSTGQLHKGGPDTGVFLQVVVPPDVDEPVPGQGHTFCMLERAQASGDLEALRDRGRRAGRVRLDALTDVGQEVR